MLSLGREHLGQSDDRHNLQTGTTSCWVSITTKLTTCIIKWIHDCIPYYLVHEVFMQFVLFPIVRLNCSSQCLHVIDLPTMCNVIPTGWLTRCCLCLTSFIKMTRFIICLSGFELWSCHYRDQGLLY